MKNKILGLLAASLLLGAERGARAEAPESVKLPKFSSSSPYAEGTEDVPLEEGTLKRLLEVTDTIADRFKDAKVRAQGKDLAQINQIYRDAFLEAVARSAKLNSKLETLSRIAINTGHQIVWGVVAEDGKTLLEPPVLDSVANTDLITTIIEDSMNLALRYYKDDRAGLEKQDLVRLPYMRFAYERLLLVEKWSRSVFEPAQAYALLVHGLKRWDSIARREDNLSTLNYAGEILQVRKAVAQAEAIARTDGKKGARNFLRGELNRLLKSLEQNLGSSDVVEALTPEVRDLSGALVQKPSEKGHRGTGGDDNGPPYSEVYAELYKAYQRVGYFEPYLSGAATQSADLVMKGKVKLSVLETVIQTLGTREGLAEQSEEVATKIAQQYCTLSDFETLYRHMSWWSDSFECLKKAIDAVHEGHYTANDIEPLLLLTIKFKDAEQVASLIHQKSFTFEDFKRAYDLTQVVHSALEVVDGPDRVSIDCYERLMRLTGSHLEAIAVCRKDKKR